MKVTVSIFPRYQNDDSKLRLFFKKILTNLSIFDALIYGITAIMAPFIVRVFYGPGYNDIVVYVQLFTVVVYLRSLGGQQGVLVITKGRTDLGFLWNIVLTIVFPIVIYLGSLKSVSSVIIYLIVLHLLLLIPSWKFFYKKLINMPLLSFIKPIVIPLLFSGLAFLVFYFLSDKSLFLQVVFSFILAFILVIYAWFQSEEFKELILKYKKLCLDLLQK